MARGRDPHHFHNPRHPVLTPTAPLPFLGGPPSRVSIGPRQECRGCTADHEWPCSPGLRANQPQQKVNPLTELNDYPDFDEAAARAEIENYDPARAMGSAATPRAVGNDNRAAALFQLSALHPDDRAAVAQRLHGITDPERRAAAEAREVEAILRRDAVSANIRRGHPNGNAYDREVAAITVEVQELEREAANIRGQLEEIARYETGPRGQALPVYRYSGLRRSEMEARLQSIAGNILELEGVGGKHRLDRAMKQELAARRTAHEERRILQMAEKRAAQIVADERIEALAQAKARNMKSNL